MIEPPTDSASVDALSQAPAPLLQGRPVPMLICRLSFSVDQSEYNVDDNLPREAVQITQTYPAAGPRPGRRASENAASR